MWDQEGHIPGTSGDVLVDDEACVIGVTSAIISPVVVSALPSLWISCRKELTLTILRDGEELAVPVTPTERPGTPA